MRVRPGATDDLAGLLRLLDGAVEWLVERGAAGQWGSEPLSASAATTAYLERIVSDGELRIAEDPTGAVRGAYVLGPRPDYAPSVDVPERYIEAMVSDRPGQGVGSLLVVDAVARARAFGASVLRADCWAEAPGLIAWYEAQGFARDGTVTVGDWPAQLLRMEVASRRDFGTDRGAARW